MVVQDLILQCYTLLRRPGALTIPMQVKEQRFSMEPLMFIRLSVWVPMFQQFRIIRCIELLRLRQEQMLPILEHLVMSWI